MMKKNNSRAVITTYILVFGTIFLILLGGLLGFILLQLKDASRKVAWNEALEIAEAGINYYKWCLNNEVEGSCQTQRDYFDPAGSKIGTFSLQIASKISCGEMVERKIISTGQTTDFPTLQRTVKVLYARPSIGIYSYILNDNVWVGPDHQIRGPYSSNGGVRMDGENQSLVTSAKAEWTCTDSFGCSPCPVSAGCRISAGSCICPGVFTTANGNRDLFSFPVPPFDFVGITGDLAQMKGAAQSSGAYLQPSKQINAQALGYHLKFKNDGTFEVWIITQLQSSYAYSYEEGWHYDYFTISNEYLYNTLGISPNCSVIFAEDNLWLEGQVKGKVTVASANLITPNVDTDVVLPGNITYANSDGSDGLALIGERNVLVGPQSPNAMEIRGIFVAQKGRFGRNHYNNNFRDQL